MSTALLLEIDGVLYRLARLPVVAGVPGTALPCWSLVALQGKRPGAIYEVRQGAGWWTCDCPDAHFRGRTCKHSRALAEVGLIEAAAEAVADP